MRCSGGSAISIFVAFPRYPLSRIAPKGLITALITQPDGDCFRIAVHDYPGSVHINGRLAGGRPCQYQAGKKSRCLSDVHLYPP